MAANDIVVKKPETIFTELERLQQSINQRAYDLFREGGPLSAGAVADWLSAERELVSKPAIELRQKDGQFEVLAALPGIEPKDVDVQITPDELLIKAEIAHEHASDEGTVHLCEFERGKVFRSIQFPQKVDPSSAKADYRNGMLHLTAAVAKTEEAQKVKVAVA